MNPLLYRTTDIYLASFLLYRDASFEGCTRLGPKKTEFRFVTGRDLHDLLRLYWSGQPTLIVPFRIFDCLRKLKSLLIAESR